eukprot:TRINITY_DN8687_c0_g1_i1.p1 TRINITY_DN8687_c0_g1~~TRINITY_DN8687_c0_g1_i1.p1  ORF type:complete len:129 (+),score=0.16 TRINITY_DN8687_c0_g1_i1:524-910(+)
MSVQSENQTSFFLFLRFVFDFPNFLSYPAWVGSQNDRVIILITTICPTNRFSSNSILPYHYTFVLYSSSPTIRPYFITPVALPLLSVNIFFFFSIMSHKSPIESPSIHRLLQCVCFPRANRLSQTLDR